MERTLAKNRPSPSNEEDYKRAYRKLNPSAERKDNYDIACVTSLTGIKGYALMDESENRSHDDEYHWVYDFISDTELEGEF